MYQFMQCPLDREEAFGRIEARLATDDEGNVVARLFRLGPSLKTDISVPMGNGAVETMLEEGTRLSRRHRVGLYIKLDDAEWNDHWGSLT